MLPIRGELYEVVKSCKRRSRSNQDWNRDWEVGDRFIIDFVQSLYRDGVKRKDPEHLVPLLVYVIFWGRHYRINSYFLEHFCVKIG